jgi:hypothetical protein
MPPAVRNQADTRSCRVGVGWGGGEEWGAFFHSARAVGGLGLRGDTAAGGRPREGQRVLREEREAEAGTMSRRRRGAQWWRGALCGNRERPEGAARFSRVDGGAEIERQESLRGGRAGRRSRGCRARQSHRRVKRREGSFYVPNLFSFSFFLLFTCTDSDMTHESRGRACAAGVAPGMAGRRSRRTDDRAADQFIIGGQTAGLDLIR